MKCRISSNAYDICKVCLRYAIRLFPALLLLYDVTNKTSFENTRAWLAEIREYAQDNVVIMLLGKNVGITTI